MKFLTISVLLLFLVMSDSTPAVSAEPHWAFVRVSSPIPPATQGVELRRGLDAFVIRRWRGGQIIGRTDDLGYRPVESPVHVHDLQATIMHALGLDHTQLTFRHQGRDHRLTDVAGEVVHRIFG